DWPSSRASRDRVQVRLHDARNAADSGEAREIARPATMFPGEVSERLHRNVDSDLVAVLEAVGHRLGRRVDTQRYAFDAALLDAFGQRLAREPRNSQARIVEPWPARLLRQRDPDLRRGLRRETMQPQRREQTEDSLGNTLRHLRQRVLRGRGMLGQHVDPAGLASNQPIAYQAGEMCPGDSACLEILWAGESLPFNQPECAFASSLRHGAGNDTKCRGLCTTPDVSECLLWLEMSAFPRMCRRFASGARHASPAAANL